MRRGSAAPGEVIALVSVNVHRVRVEAHERNGTIWLDVVARGSGPTSLPSLTVFLDDDNVLPLKRQLDAIAAGFTAAGERVECEVAEESVPVEG